MSANEFGLSESHPSSNVPVPAEQCDVSQKESLKAYRSKRERWLRWHSFTKEHPNSIQGQILGMTFLDMSYRMLAKPRVDTPQYVKIAARNGLLAHLLDQGYVATQVLSIRRLLDNAKGCVSIKRLLTEIKSSHKLLTRQNYVAYDGIPYDPDGWKSLPRTVEAAIWGVDAPEFFTYLRSGFRHQMFDKLSGKSATSRSRGDLIQPFIFERLEGWLYSIEAKKLVKLSHEFFAHAAERSHGGTLEYKGVLLSDIEAAQRAIVRVERAIMDDILFIQTAREVVASEPLGFLQALDLPYVEAEMIEQMEKRWDELRADRNGWKDGYREELYAPPT